MFRKLLSRSAKGCVSHFLLRSSFFSMQRFGASNLFNLPRKPYFNQDSTIALLSTLGTVTVLGVALDGSKDKKNIFKDDDRKITTPTLKEVTKAIGVSPNEIKSVDRSYIMDAYSIEFAPDFLGNDNTILSIVRDLRQNGIEHSWCYRETDMRSPLNRITIYGESVEHFVKFVNERNVNKPCANEKQISTENKLNCSLRP